MKYADIIHRENGHDYIRTREGKKMILQGESLYIKDCCYYVETKDYGHVIGMTVDELCEKLHSLALI